MKVVLVNANPKSKGALATLVEEGVGGAEVEALRLAGLNGPSL